jgi:NADPH2 dehydrogenase
VERDYVDDTRQGMRNILPALASGSECVRNVPVRTASETYTDFVCLPYRHRHVLEAEGFRLLSSSAVPITAQDETPEAMTEEEIQETISDYAIAARNAIAAGFDGVEIHGANGYLPDQFLQTTCNKRTDQWGGSIENRARFHLEVTQAVVAAVGADRTAMRLSPYSNFNGMLMDEPEPTFEYLLKELKPFGLSYLHLIEARIQGNDDSDCGGQKSVCWMIKSWNNSSPVVLAGGFLPDSAKQTADETYKDFDVIIAFGRYFVANPDLVFRVKHEVPLVKYDRAVFYTPKEPKGYIDYAFSQQYLEARAGA